MSGAAGSGYAERDLTRRPAAWLLWTAPKLVIVIGVFHLRAGWILGALALGIAAAYSLERFRGKYR